MTVSAAGIAQPSHDEHAAMMAAGRHALALVNDGARIGLGSGRTASMFILLLGERVKEGLRVEGVPASRATEALARDAGIPLVSLDRPEPLDLTIDGADEVAPSLDLIKGHGGALVRERIVAAASRRQVIVVDAGKLVARLGERMALPVEVIPFALGPVTRAIAACGLAPQTRTDGAGTRALVNENGNLTLDCAFAAPLADAAAAREIESALLAIPGVVDTGLFLATAERVIVGHPDGRVDVHVR